MSHLTSTKTVYSVRQLIIDTIFRQREYSLCCTAYSAVLYTRGLLVYLLFGQQHPYNTPNKALEKVPHC